MGSMSSFQPVPYINVYGATKAFVLSFSRALNVELKPRGIPVLAVCPYWVGCQAVGSGRQAPLPQAGHENMVQAAKSIG